MPYATKAKKAAYDRERWQRKKATTEGRVVRDLRIKVPRHGLKIAVINDVQAMPGVPLDHLRCAGLYIADKRPDVIVCLGDFGDFPSLSRFDRGTRLFEGRRYKKDLAAFHEAMELLMNPIAKARGYKPHLEFCLGNHEDHLERATIEDPKLEGLISTADLQLADYGWRQHAFLQQIAIGGVAFCHYFPFGARAQPISSAAALLRKLHMSAVAGHQQGRDIAYGKRADGRSMTAIISGSFYQHSYDFLPGLADAHWRGMYMLHEVKDGSFDEMALSVNYLLWRFGR